MPGSKNDIRWVQRFDNFQKALARLKEAERYIQGYMQNINGIEMDILREGLIQRFEFTYELAWNVMKDYAYFQGNFDIKGSRDAIRYAFEVGLITDGTVWMEMLQSRNQTTHMYDEAEAERILGEIMSKYIGAFSLFEDSMMRIKARSV